MISRFQDLVCDKTFWRHAALATCSVVLVRVLSKKVAASRRSAYLKRVARTAVAKRNCKSSRILEMAPSQRALLTALETREGVINGVVDPRANVVFLAQRCAQYGRKNCTNAITEEFYDEAFDTDISAAAKAKAPLCGVPISIKDCIGMRGALQTGGLACRAEETHRCNADSIVVKILRMQGALPMVRGNVSQSMMLPESINNIFGTSRNPWDLSRTPGGSSGGDAALVAMRCVPLAVGSDVAGSVRIPAAFCGIVGFKPTPGRISKRGSMMPRVGNRHGLQVTIPAVFGPLGVTVDDCAQLLRALWCDDHFRADVSTVPFKFNEDAFRGVGSHSRGSKMRFGYFVTDGWFEPCEAAKRAMLETVDALTKAGHECVKFDVPVDGWKLTATYASLATAEGNLRGMVEGAEGEPLISAYHVVQASANIPNFLRPLIAPLLGKRRGLVMKLTRSGGVSTHDFLQRSADTVEIREAWAKAFEEAGVDAVIHPTLPLPALPHGTSSNLLTMCSYTLLANLLLWPSGTVPVTTVRGDEQHYSMEALPLNQRDFLARRAAEVMQGSAGLPIGIAALTPPLRDEVCLRAMKEIERVMKFIAKPVAYLKAGH
eukprot:TRINITY_DN44669_c0_g1_i1.p1 TRINITY_DN44669_c0_g1~~TRINITY_DN44669_c0_g1_i1.p1  ORF type:complete len:603 (+),score=85.45 TRINITY_DN44669_c0_g1_i1:84-1892(+)